MPRVIGFVVHNWPLKVAAIALATLLYGGLVLSQATQPFASPVPIQIANAPANVIVLSEPGSVTGIRYVAPPDLGFRVDEHDVHGVGRPAQRPGHGRPRAGAGHGRGGRPRSRSSTSSLVRSRSRSTASGASRSPSGPSCSPLPSGLDAGEPVAEQTTANVRGPQSIVNTVAEVQARGRRRRARASTSTSSSPSSRSTTRASASARPRASRSTRRRSACECEVFTDRRSKTLPVSPTVNGTPAAGFEIDSVEVDPTVVSVEGDANDLAGLDHADTAPVSVAGASSEFVQTVGLGAARGRRRRSAPARSR